MTFTLGPRAAQAGHRVREYASLDSTNSEALRLARGGERGLLWIVTREQTAGRGRRGRSWVSAPGNLAASFLFADEIAPPLAATLGFAASLAVCEACRSLAPGAAFSVKWPNDVLANREKVSGILLESEVQGRSLAIVTGFGMNLAQSPDGLAFPATSLLELGAAVTPQTAFSRLSDAFAGLLAVWQHGRGVAEIRRLWLENAQGLGQPVSIRIGERIETGIFEALDEQGRLMLRRADGSLQPVSAGDVYFGQAASAGASASGVYS
jgi:BirA family biotin operon repressor/biotin-[acetyl-CoA-carboxylase] ligase